MFHCNGWCTPWAVTAIGGTHVCLREVRGDVIWSLIREHGVTHLNGAPTVVTTILRDKAAARLETPIVMTTAGAPPSPTTIRAAEEMGFRIVHVYGLTETYGPYSVNAYRAEDLQGDDRSAKQARQGVRDDLRRPHARGRQGHERRPRATAPRWARSSCAATTS